MIANRKDKIQRVRRLNRTRQGRVLNRIQRAQHRRQIQRGREILLAENKGEARKDNLIYHRNGITIEHR